MANTGSSDHDATANPTPFPALSASSREVAARLGRTLALGLCCAFAAACGGGGGGSGSAGGAGLALHVDWQRRESVAAAASFADPIPLAVQTLRLKMVIGSGDDRFSCCSSVRRGSEAFENRQLSLPDLPPGPVSVRISGFPGKVAPADGTTDRCPVVPENAAGACDDDASDPPSFDSDPVVDTVTVGRTTTISVDVYSLPFLIEQTPPPGADVLGPEARIAFSIVDGASPVDPQFDVAVRRVGPQTLLPLKNVEALPCDDRDADPAQHCSSDPDLDVSGFRVTAVTEPADDGAITVEVAAANEAAPPRSLDTLYGLEIVSTATTTTTTSTTTTTTTSTTSTTTTTTSTTTTTTTLPVSTVAFSVVEAVDVAGLSFEADYANAPGNFVGSGALVECLTPLQGAIGSYNDDDAARVLSAAVASASAFQGPIVVVACTFVGDVPTANDFAVTLLEATAPDLSDIVVTVVPDVTAAQVLRLR